MKAIILCSALALIALPIVAQEKTLISGDIESGGYGGPVLQVTQINKQSAVLAGGVGGWIINHTIVLGGGGYGLVTDVTAKYPDPFYGSQYLTVGYGGLYLEYIASSDEVIHLTVGALVGAGSVGYKNQDMFNMNRSIDQFFVLEPNIQLNLNVTQFFRISAGANYRWVTGVQNNITSNADLSGPSGMLMLRFGMF
jgi:hypothetical protein